jgi:class 3 adenylate cyclase/tetratricopeptide (TPR) repeat protein
MKCRECQTENPEGMKFCGKCGAKLERICPRCNFSNPLDFAFCGKCGQKLEVIEKVEPTIEGERKQVTVLFSDLSGYTAMSERLDPEEVKNLMRRIFGEITQVVAKYDGSIEKFIGDAVVAFFGVPKAHEDDPMRAIRAAKEIHEIIDAMSHQFEPRVGKPLSMHTGINTGLVVTGEVTMEKGTLGVTGDTVNVAQRLSGLAKPGVILVGQDTFLQTQGYFEFEKQEPTRVKGKTEAVPIYKMLEPKYKVDRLKGLATQGISSALVGRDAEFVALKGCLNRLLDGQGGIVCIIGEAGIGKSRLMAEIRNYIRNTQAISSLQWLEGRTLSYGQKISYWPFQEIIWHYAGITEDDSEAEASQKLESRISSLFAEEAREILPYLSTFLGLGVRGEYAEGLKYLDGKSMGSQIYLTSRRFFERLARVQPLVLVFEDLHWVDESSMLLLEHLLPLILRVPILICGISRTDPKIPIERLREIATKEYERRYTELRLSPLSQSDSLQMMHNLMEIDNLSSTMREKIVHKVDGNPFFLEEIMRSLIDTGAVVHDSSTERWKTTEKLDQFTIPDTIQGVIMARVDRLGEEIKQVLRTAAVIGRSFLYRVLKTIAEEVRELDRDLDQLQTVELIRVKQKIPELEYIFKHALVQETTYGSILLQRRRELHSKVGQAIEALFPDRLEEFYSLLAYHYARAENWEKAQDYLFKAGDQAGKIAADAEALTHYQEAIETYARVFGDKWNPIQRVSLERKMGEAFFRRGEYQKAMEYLQRALVYFGRPKLPTSRSKIGLGILGEIAVQIVHHIFSRWLIKKTYGPVDPAVEEMGRIYQIVEGIDGVTGAPEHLLLTNLKCLNFSERKGRLAGAVGGYAGLGLAAFVLSLPRLSRFILQRAMAVSEKIQDPATLFGLNMIFALIGFYEGQLKRAIEDASRGVEDYRRSGSWSITVYGYTLMFTSLAYLYQGDFSRALTLARELIHLGEDGNDLNTYVVGLLTLGNIQERKGELEESVATLKKGIELSEAIPIHESRVWDGYILGRCYLRLGDLERSLDILTKTNNWMAKHHFRGLNPIVVSLGFLQVYLAAAEQAVERKREEWLRKAKRVCKKLLRSAKVKRLFLPEAIRLQGNYQWLRRKPSFAEKCWERSLGLAEEMGMRYELGMTHLEMGRRLKDRAYLEKAEAIFAEIGAEFDLSQTRKLLQASTM